MANQIDTLEAQICAVLENYRQMTFSVAEDHMKQALREIAVLIDSRGLSGLSHRGVSGFSERTLREVYRLHLKGQEADSLEQSRFREILLEYLKARSLTFESIRIKYPNYLKPWKKEDDETLELQFRQGIPVEEIAQTLQRNPNAVEMRIDKLRLRDK